MNIELPKDAEGREIPLNTSVLYDENGKKLHITSFTYKCDVLRCARRDIQAVRMDGR